MFEVAAADDQEPVETLRSDGADEPLGVGVRLRRSQRRVDHHESLAAEHLVERSCELAVAVMDQEPHPLEHAGEAEVARLLSHPGAGGIGRATGEMDAPAAKLDEEEHVQAAQGDGLDGEEVAGEHARGLPTKECRPAYGSSPRRWLEPSGGKQAAHRARREAKAELQSSPAIRW